jgi:hypothetical protein
MKYSGSDFKMTSQANHMSKLKELRKEYERIGFHLQRLYKRRKTDATGRVRSTFGSIMSSSVRKGIVNNTQNSGSNKEDAWEDMEEGPIIPPSEDPGKDNWEDMEDLPNDSDPSEDDWDSM